MSLVTAVCQRLNFKQTSRLTMQRIKTDYFWKIYWTNAFWCSTKQTSLWSEQMTLLLRAHTDFGTAHFSIQNPDLRPQGGCLRFATGSSESRDFYFSHEWTRNTVRASFFLGRLPQFCDDRARRTRRRRRTSLALCARTTRHAGQQASICVVMTTPFVAHFRRTVIAACRLGRFCLNYTVTSLRTPRSDTDRLMPLFFDSCYTTVYCRTVWTQIEIRSTGSHITSASVSQQRTQRKTAITKRLCKPTSSRLQRFYCIVRQYDIRSIM